MYTSVLKYRNNYKIFLLTNKTEGVDFNAETMIEFNISSYISMTRFLTYRNEMTPVLNERHKFE